jgi:hypothetical protein
MRHLGMALWSQGNSFTAAPGLPFRMHLSILGKIPLELKLCFVHKKLLLNIYRTRLLTEYKFILWCCY